MKLWGSSKTVRTQGLDGNGGLEVEAWRTERVSPRRTREHKAAKDKDQRAWAYSVSQSVSLKRENMKTKGRPSAPLVPKRSETALPAAHGMGQPRSDPFCFWHRSDPSLAFIPRPSFPSLLAHHSTTQHSTAPPELRPSLPSARPAASRAAAQPSPGRPVRIQDRRGVRTIFESLSSKEPNLALVLVLLLLLDFRLGLAFWALGPGSRSYSRSPPFS